MAELQEEGKPLLNAQVLYREWGRRFTTLHQYLKGIHYYEKSTEYGDENFLWTLLGLSEALKKSGQFKRAAEVAEKCMNIDADHLGACHTRMEALFDVGEFGRSLVYAQRGLRRSRRFEEAVLLAQGTLDDCVGANVSTRVLRELQPWIAGLVEHRRLLLERLNDEEDEFEGIDEEQSKFKVDDPAARLKRQLARLDRYLAALYLGLSAHDKGFLQALLRPHPDLASANQAGSARLTEVVRECLARLRSQQDALRTRKPVYAVRAQAAAALTRARVHEDRRQLELRRCLARRQAGRMLRGIHQARLARDYPSFFRLVERAKEKFESLGARLLPERDKLLDAVYLMVARAYIDPRNLLRLSGAPAGVREAHLRRALGLRAARLPRDAELAWPACLDVRAALRRCRERLALAHRPLEILWIFHELCKHFLQIGRHDLARFYSKKTQELSLASGHEEWALNASHVLLRIELGQHNRTEAREAAHGALDSARKLKLDFLVDFYERALELIEALDWEQLAGDDGAAARARLMLGLASPELRPRLGLLLRAMDALPARRRLAIMPGCKPAAAGRRRSVLPSPHEDHERQARTALLRKYAPSKRVLGITDFDEYD